MLWYNNPESVLAQHDARRETWADQSRHSLRLVVEGK
jgi:hypothetical protein